MKGKTLLMAAALAAMTGAATGCFNWFAKDKSDKVKCYGIEGKDWVWATPGECKAKGGRVEAR